MWIRMGYDEMALSSWYQLYSVSRRVGVNGRMGDGVVSNVSPSSWLVEHFRVCRSFLFLWSIDLVQSSDGVFLVETWELNLGV